MKKVLIVSAHPEKASFCMSLKQTAVNSFLMKGYEVMESDLYAMHFDPVGNRSDFKSINNPDFFKYQLEQVHANENDLFVDVLKTEMEKLEWCDILIFSFPLWWFGMPDILKGWVDRVFAMGFVYGAGKGVYENGIYPDKTAFITLTTGGPLQAYGPNGKNGDLNSILFPIHHGVFYFTGMTVLPPFISFGPARSTVDDLNEEIKRHKEYLNNIDHLKPIYSNRDDNSLLRL